jgi:hypothetical protein
MSLPIVSSTLSLSLSPSLLCLSSNVFPSGSSPLSLHLCHLHYVSDYKTMNAFYPRPLHFSFLRGFRLWNRASNVMQ